MSRLTDAWRNILANDDGLRVLMSIIEISGFFGVADPQAPSIAWYHGRRSVGAEIWHRIAQIEPTLLVRMLHLKVNDDVERRQRNRED